MSEQLIQTPGVFGDNGNFLLERELGSGGMGGVYMGRDKMLDRPVAVKVMLKELGTDAEFLEKFKKEAQAAARLIHPNIVQIYSYGVSDSMPYIAMELAAGGSLYSLMNANPGKTDIQRVLKICQQTAQALQCATDQGVIHGDVKPENILLDSNGNAKLVDFGLAAMQKDTEEIWGTPYYISPEKVKKEQIDFRSDMYSLGATLYHALTGVAPFEGPDSVAVVKKRFEGSPVKPSVIRPDITPAVDTLIMTMIDLDRDKRYPSFEALLQAFRDVLTTGLTQKADRPEGAVPPPRGLKRPTGLHGRRMVVKKPVTENTGVSKPSETHDEEENGGNLGVKVALFVIGGILAIGLVIGALVWYQIAQKNSSEAEHRGKVASTLARAKSSIQDWKTKANNFNAEFEVFAKEATVECQKVTDEIAKLLPDYADQLNPGQTDELRKAIANTNTMAQTAQTAASTSVSNAPQTVAAANVSAVVEPPKKLTIQEEAKKYGLELPDDLDPASPDGADFLEKLKAARAQAALKAKKPAEQTAAPAATGEEEKKVPQEVLSVHELWERAYACQACQIRVWQAAQNIIKEADASSAITGDGEDAAKAFGECSVRLKTLYDNMTGSKDVETVKKGISMIKSKGGRLVKQTDARIRREKAEADRLAKLIEQKRLEEEARRKAEEERKALIERETNEIAAKFDAITAQGCFRQLDWDSAIRQLKSASQSFKTAEGELAFKLQMKKVEQMKLVQDIFIKHLKGHVFRGALKGAKVTSVDAKEILLVRKDSKLRVSWQKFYKEYPGNFNELISNYIVNGRKNSGLSALQWRDAMSGAALTMRLVCMDVNGANERAESLAKEVVKQIPEFEKSMKDIFPDITFEVQPED